MLCWQYFLCNDSLYNRAYIAYRYTYTPRIVAGTAHECWNTRVYRCRRHETQMHRLVFSGFFTLSAFWKLSHKRWVLVTNSTSFYQRKRKREDCVKIVSSYSGRNRTRIFEGMRAPAVRTRQPLHQTEILVQESALPGHVILFQIQERWIYPTKMYRLSLSFSIKRQFVQSNLTPAFFRHF